ncbi:putative malate dehydrogenase 1B [Myxocyprinus asiaticus]|uniref:putative malate dehydrogenase 1B n=1 Tax=Myxocyprinus asiaticus TaxID=70543 RepID=UPI002222E2ED|nr:putative malate dehydrogenase 1B [Myxocyprinus asiaticus]
MAKFVLAGKAYCPYYAKAELLSDILQRNLPDFHIHKICVQPNDRKVNLSCNCSCWKHSSSPIVWRELTDHGGKCMLHRGFNDFGYYGIRSDMTTDLMLKIAEENLQTKELCVQEEVNQWNSFRPLHIWINITSVIVWVNVSGSYHVDLQLAKVFKYDGAILGPDGFSQPVMDMIYDHCGKWLESDFMGLLHKHSAIISFKTNRATAISTTNGIVTVLKAWNNNESAEEVFSLGVLNIGKINSSNHNQMV